MSNLFHKMQSGVRQHVADRISDAASAPATAPGARRAGVLAGLAADILSPSTGGAIGSGKSAIGAGLGAASDAAASLLSPGTGPVYGAINDAMRAVSRPSVVLPALALPVGAAALIALKEDEYHSGRADYALRLSEAEHRGATPMSDPFNSFVQKRASKHTEKSASLGTLRALMGQGVGALGEGAKKLLHRPGTRTDMTDTVQDLMRGLSQNQMGAAARVGAAQGGNIPPQMVGKIDKMTQDGLRDLLSKMDGVSLDPATGRYFRQEASEFSMPRAGLAALGLLGIGSAVDLGESIADPLADTYGYRANRRQNSLTDRVRADEITAESFFKSMGKNTADSLRDLAHAAVGSTAGAASSVPRGLKQQRVFENAVQSDEYLRGAAAEEKLLLSRAFDTMARFAPEVATDEFAVRNYLRESLLSSSGPDYATISNLARTNEAVSPRPRR